ncbi:hypothetical protein BSKO_00268 [Bryopsis sp. KO-2023]|nr:hypothetical protein BSKO_00268 [Bryopsis sp. KO-2023]
MSLTHFSGGCSNSNRKGIFDRNGWGTLERSRLRVRTSRIRSQLAEVYVMKKPLVGWEVLEKAMGPLYPQELALHCMVLVQESENEMWLCDFLPIDPLNPETAVSLLSGGSAQGTNV